MSYDLEQPWNHIDFYEVWCEECRIVWTVGDIETEGEKHHLETRHHVRMHKGEYLNQFEFWQFSSREWKL
jgi:hypothetical protein